MVTSSTTATDASAASPVTTTAPVNAVIQDLADRLKRKDPTLSTVSLRRLPLSDVTPTEVLHILQALLEASSTTKKSIPMATTATTSTATTGRRATMAESVVVDDDTDDIATVAAAAYDNNNDDDEESLACPISTLQMWLPDHPSNNNSSSRSSNLMLNDYSFNSSFTDSNDGDFLLDVSESNLAVAVLAVNNNNNNNIQMQMQDSLQSMDWEERGNTSNNTGVMSIVEEEEQQYDENDDDEHENDHSEDESESDENDNASAVMGPLEPHHALQEEHVQPHQPHQQEQQEAVGGTRRHGLTDRAALSAAPTTAAPLPPPDYSIITPVLANNTSITTLAVSSAPSSAAWKALFGGIGQNKCITTLELGDPCLIADPCTLDTNACKALAEEVLNAASSKRTRRRMGNDSNGNSKTAASSSSSSSSSSLRHLVLRSFSLPFQGVEYLARGFENKSSLESVELQQIETDPGSFGRILESLASPSSQVKSVVLVDCDLGIDMLLDDHPLTLLLSTSRSLETLRMTECQVTSVELQAMAAATPPPSLLNSNALLRPPLKVLDLRGNELGNDAAPALAELVDKQTSLRKLILEENQLGDEALLEYLAVSLARHPSLRKLNLRGNALSSKSVSRTLILPASLEVLDLSENHLGGGGAAAAFSSSSNSTSDWAGFFQANSHRATNWSFVLEAARLADADLVSLCQGLEQSPTCSLRSLNVSQNTFGTNGMQAVASLLSSSSPVSSLVHSTSTTNAPPTLATISTKRITMIQSLNLSSCHLSDHDIAILAQGLTRCPSLRQVYLGFNQIGNSGCQSLGMALAEKTCHVQELELQFNPFGATGLNHLVQGLKQNIHLHHITVLNDDSVLVAAAQEGDDRTKQLIREMVHWLSLNRAGRQALSCSCSLPTAIWPTILARASKVYGPTACYYLLQEQSSRVA